MLVVGAKMMADLLLVADRRDIICRPICEEEDWAQDGALWNAVGESDIELVSD